MILWGFFLYFININSIMAEILPSNIIFYKFIYFIYLFLAALGLCCCTRAFSSSLWCTGFSLRWLLLLWNMGSRHVGFSSCST